MGPSTARSGQEAALDMYSLAHCQVFSRRDVTIDAPFSKTMDYPYMSLALEISARACQ